MHIQSLRNEHVKAEHEVEALLAQIASQQLTVGELHVRIKAHQGEKERDEVAKKHLSKTVQDLLVRARESDSRLASARTEREEAAGDATAELEHASQALENLQQQHQDTRTALEKLEKQRVREMMSMRFEHDKTVAELKLAVQQQTEALQSCMLAADPSNPGMLPRAGPSLFVQPLPSVRGA